MGTVETEKKKKKKKGRSLRTLGRVRVVTERRKLDLARWAPRMQE